MSFKVQCIDCGESKTASPAERWGAVVSEFWGWMAQHKCQAKRIFQDV